MDINFINKIFNYELVFLIIITNLSYSSFEKNDTLHVSDTHKHEFQCHEWNATIITKADSLRKLVQATFEPFAGYEKCFTYFIIYLHLLKPSRFECNHLSNGIGKKLKRVWHNQKVQKNYEVNFTDLDAGYYCILIKPCAEKCYEALLASNVTRIEEVLTVTSDKNIIKETTTSSKILDIPYIFIILISTLIFGIIIYLNYKHRKIKKIPDGIVENEEKMPFLKPSDTEVFILYYSAGDTKRQVDCLADFLQECAEFNVTVIDDRHAPIHFNPYIWLGEHLQCCSKINGNCTCNRRVIIVVTKPVLNYLHSRRKAVKDLNELAKNENGSCTFSFCSADYDDMEIDWFCYGLDRILNDWSKCFKDYTHFFVVYFDDTLYDEVIMIAPDVRYSIQHHLVKLCQELNYSFNDAACKDKLLKYLVEHPIKDIISTT